MTRSQYLNRVQFTLASSFDLIIGPSKLPILDLGIMPLKRSGALKRFCLDLMVRKIITKLPSTRGQAKSLLLHAGVEGHEREGTLHLCGCNRPRYLQLNLRNDLTHFLHQIIQIRERSLGFAHNLFSSYSSAQITQLTIFRCKMLEQASSQ